MTKTLNQIFFLPSTKIRIFFSATFGIRIFFRKKTITPRAPTNMATVTKNRTYGKIAGFG
jgi:hypothetical protein